MKEFWQKNLHKFRILWFFFNNDCINSITEGSSSVGNMLAEYLAVLKFVKVFFM